MMATDLRWVKSKPLTTPLADDIPLEAYRVEKDADGHEVLA